MQTLVPSFYFGDAKGPSIVGVESATYLLSRGARPSVCQVQMPYNPNLRKGPFPMTWSDGFRSITFKDCIINDVQTSNGNGQVMSIAILDRRWKWEYPRISGKYNVRRAGNSIVKGTKKSIRDLVALCLEALGEKKGTYDISKMPNDVYPYVDWNYGFASAALESLCQMSNSHICLCHDDKIRIFRDGVGNELPAIPSSNSSVGFEFGHRPGYVGVASGLFRWQFDFELEPVGVDADNSIKPIDELSYAPKAKDEAGNEIEGTVDWGEATFTTMAGVRADCRRLAVESVWRWYRIKLDPRLDKEKPKMPHINEPIYSIEQLLPLLSEQLEYVPLHGLQLLEFVKGSYDETSRERKPAQIWGLFATPDGTLSDNVKKDQFNFNVDLDFYDVKIDADDGKIVPTEAMKKVQKYIYHWGYQVDWERGIVKFADPVMRKEDRFNKWKDRNVRVPVPARIYLRTSCNFRDVQSRAGYRWGYKVPVPGAPDKNLHSWEVHDEIVPEWRWSNKGSKPKAIVNIAEVEKQADYYVQHAMEKYRERIPGNMTVPQLLQFSPDGKIAQVVFQIDGEGYISTTINKEIEGLNNIPDYKARQAEVRRQATEDLLKRQQGQQTPDPKDPRQ